MLVAVIILCWVAIAVVWTMDFLFKRIETKYNNKQRRIEQVSRFIKRNEISPEEAELLYELLLH